MLIGHYGFRFGSAGAVVDVQVAPSDVPWGARAEVEEVFWIGDPDRVRGWLYRTPDDGLRLAMRLTRLAVRQGQFEALHLFPAAGDSIHPLPLAIPATGWDLDNGRTAAVQADVGPALCVAAEAGFLTLREFENVARDRVDERLSSTEGERIAARLRGFLASGAPLCR